MVGREKKYVENKNRLDLSEFYLRFGLSPQIQTYNKNEKIQQIYTCWKSAIETLETVVKHIQS